MVSVRPRVAPAGCDDISEDVCVAFADAVVQLDALELEGVLRRHQLQFKARRESFREAPALPASGGPRVRGAPGRSQQRAERLEACAQAGSRAQHMVEAAGFESIEVSKW